MPLTTLPAPFPWAAPLLAAPPVVTVTVGGNVVVLMPGSLNISDAVGMRSVATFVVQDYTGRFQFKAGQPVAIYDPNMNLIYGGVVVSSKRAVASALSSTLLHDVTCTDWHYLADKRLAATSYAYRTCGYMARNLVDSYLAAEGVTYGRGVNLLTAQQSDIETNAILPSFVADGTGVTLFQTSVPANVHHGGGALQIVTDGTVAHQGFEARVTNAANNFPYGAAVVCSVWLRASFGTPTAQLFVNSPGGVVDIAINCVLSTSWQRFVICSNLGLANRAYYALAVDTGASAQALTIWADQLQMELATPRPWAPGGGVSQNLLTAEEADVESATLAGAFAVHGAGGVTTIVQDTTTAWSGAASLKVVMDGTFAFQGVDVTGVPNTGQFPIGSIITFSFWASSASPIVLYIASPGIGQSTAYGSLTPGWQRFQYSIQVTSAAPKPVLFQILTPTAQAGTFWIDGLQMEIGAAPTAWELGGTVQTVQEGPEVVSQIINYKQVATALDDLATLAGFIWWIDQNKVLHFQAASAYLAPWTLDGTQALDGMLELENANPLYRNSQWMLGSTGITSAQTENHAGDGQTRVFPTSFPIHQTPSDIHINSGAAQTIGILGVDTGKAWYWNKGKIGVTQDASGTLLATTDVLHITYVGEYQVVTNSIDGAQQSLEAALEGAGTGLVEQVTADTSLVSLGQAFQSGAALLAKFAVFATTIRFRTRVAGLAPGQLLTVNLPPVWQFSAQAVLIESVTITYDDYQLWYDVRALVGPVDATWVQFWQNVSSKQAIIDQTVATATTTVALAAPTETAAWNWTASFTATVTACPVFPLTLSPATLC